MTHPIGLAALTVLELSPPDMVSCAAGLGFDHIGLRLIPATDTEVQHPMVGDTALVRETTRRLADTGLRCLDIEILRLRPDTVVSDYAAVLETGARLGAREVLVAGNDPDHARLVAHLAALCELAAGFGLGINLEPMPWTDCPSCAVGRALVQAVDQTNAGLLIDPIHFDRAGGDPAELRQLPPRLLRYMQLCDAPAERPTTLDGLLHQARAERMIPGEGGLPLAAMIAAVPPDLPLSLEIPMQQLSQTLPARERCERMLTRTRRWLAGLGR